MMKNHGKLTRCIRMTSNFHIIPRASPAGRGYPYPPPTRHFPPQYSSLADVTNGKKVDVYGVVKFVKAPFKSRGSDHCVTLSITDTSFKQSEQKLKCNIFAQEEGKLPLVKVGDIIRFHRLGISRFNGELQASNSPGLSWLIFSGSKKSPVEPRKASSKNYTFTDKDKEIVQKLRGWIEQHEEFQEKLVKFEDVVVGCYFDTICQVVCTAIVEADVCMLLRCWDGTQSMYKSKGREENTMTDIKVSETLQRNAKDFLVDVFVFDDHFRSAQSVQPGDFVKFYNLHVVEMPPDDETAPSLPGVPPMEIYLHRGNSYGRSLTVIPPDSLELKSLKRRLRKKSVVADTETEEKKETSPEGSAQKSVNEIATISSESSVDIQRKRKDAIDAEKAGNHGNLHDSQEPSTSGVQHAKKTKQINTRDRGQVRHVSQEPSTSGVQIKRKISEVVSGDMDISVEQGQDVAGMMELSQEGYNQTSSGVSRCMLRTASITLNHPNITPTQINDVLDHEVPYKFRIRAKVMDYFPKPVDVESFLRLYCSQCHYLCPLPRKDCNENENRGNSVLQVGSTFNGIVHYNCPRCYSNKDSLTDMESPTHLQFIYMMRFLLRDESGTLMANLWRSEAEVFFQNTEASKLVQYPSYLTQICDNLQQLCPGEWDMDGNPWVECCVRSYSVADGSGYHIFDTTIV